jgi:predicted CoA-substrate-specific enzyme activase
MRNMDAYLGIDVGSVTTKLAVIDNTAGLLAHLYLTTEGRPLVAIQRGMQEMSGRLPDNIRIKGVAATGSARYLAGAVIGADLVKNEITCQAVSAVHYVPEVRTVIEIGGQDSKIIIIRDGMVSDFGMNTVCAAGTGSFLDHQAARLRLGIEQFSEMALKGKDNVSISGRCTVFAESDMVHKQQMGHNVEDIIYGLCRTLVRNYLSDVGSGKDIQPPVVFQGGVAFNRGIIRALEEELKTEVFVPEHHEVMGAIGAALLVRENTPPGACRFRGFEIGHKAFSTSSFACRACPTSCEIMKVTEDDRLVACWGGQCDKWEESTAATKENN